MYYNKSSVVQWSSRKLYKPYCLVFFMRVVLRKNKQVELVNLAKINYTWRELSRLVGLSEGYLRNEVRKERVFLSEDVYFKLCRLAKVDFKEFVLKKLVNNWGQSLGGKNSSGSTIKLQAIAFNEDLAEFVGAVLGDGHVCFIKSSDDFRHTGTYSIRIAGEINKESDYHLNYLKSLVKKIFNLEAKEILSKKSNTRFLDISSKELVELFIFMGIKPGNKIENQSTIPQWIFDNNDYLRCCLRGLIDTDGSIFRMSKRDSNLIRINFTNHNFSLLNDVYSAFVKLGFHPSKIINNKQFYISRQKEVWKYLKEIGFSNNKHINRLKSFKVP